MTAEELTEVLLVCLLDELIAKVSREGKALKIVFPDGSERTVSFVEKNRRAAEHSAARRSVRGGVFKDCIFRGCIFSDGPSFAVRCASASLCR